MRGNVQALFGGEGLVFLGNQDPASYPTLFVSFALIGHILETIPVRGQTERLVEKNLY